MIKNFKKYLFAVAAFLLVAIIIISIAIRHVPNYSFPKYAYVNTVTDKFTNKDSNIKFDGDLSDTIWKAQRWFRSSMKTDPSVEVAMTSYFGTDGIYIAFDVKDTTVYYSDSRSTANNSGIEFYIAPPSAFSDITDKGYEIDINANGKTSVRKYINGKYKATPADIHAVVTTDGKINSGACKGYQIELYLPYKMFGGKVKSVYSMPAIIRTVSAEDTKRQWYNFGTNDKTAIWTKAGTWWTFDGNGLVSFDVDIDTTGGGTITGKDYVAEYTDYSFEVMPDKGYYASYITINGKNVANDLDFTNGKASYTVVDATEALDIQAEFQKMPDETESVSGKIISDNTYVPTLYAVKNGWSMAIPVNQNGSFTTAIPKIAGISFIASRDGYITKKVNAGNVDITLDKLDLGNNSNVKHRPFNPDYWAFSMLYSGKVRLLNGGYNVTAMNSDIYSDTVFVSSSIRLPVKPAIDSRAGFIFCNEYGNTAYICITMENEKGQDDYCIQIISRDGKSWNVSGKITDIRKNKNIYEKIQTDEGVTLSVLYQNGKFDIWIDGEKYADDVYPVDDDGNSYFSSDTKVGVGLQGWGNKTVFNNLVMRPTGPIAADKAFIGGYDIKYQVSGNGTVSGDKVVPKGDYSKFYIMPDADYYASSVIVNGQEVNDQISYENKKAFYTIKNVENNVDVHVTFSRLPVQSITISGTITDGVHAIKDAKGYYAIGGAIKSFAIRSDSTYIAAITSLKGSICVECDGYLTSMNLVSNSDNGILNIVMTKTSFGSNKNVTHKPVELSLWDLSQLSYNKIDCLSDSFRVTLMESRIYSDYISATADISLPKVDGKDTRAGFVFYDKNGNDVFVCLTMSNEKYQFEYTVQVISGKGTSWKNSGGITYIEKYSDLKDKASSETGLPFRVVYNNGKFDIYINNSIVGSGVTAQTRNGQTVFSNSRKVAVGLQSWNYKTKFKNIKISDSREKVKTYDDTGLNNGNLQSLSYKNRNYYSLDLSYSKTKFASADITLPKVAGTDTRAGFSFRNSAGKDSVIALTMNNERGQYVYNINVISNNGKSYSYNGKIDAIANRKEVVDKANSDGVRFSVLYTDGRFKIWVGEKLVAENISVPDNYFGNDTAVSVGTETWYYPSRFKNLSVLKTAPNHMPSERYDSDWLIKKNYAECLVHASTSVKEITSAYSSKISVSSSITLPRQEAIESRAGYRFTDERGNYVVAALTMSNERGQYTYSVQIIGNGSSWTIDGSITSIASSTDIVSAANSKKGVEFDVDYEDGLFTITVNGHKVAKNVCSLSNGKKTLSGNGVKLSLDNRYNKTVYNNFTVK